MAANLVAGNVRMLFIADALPPELIRIIEFLNEQMDPAEVLGIELRQYVGGEHKVFVPRVIGRTSPPVSRRPVSGQQWTRETFLQAAQQRCSAEEAALIHRLLADVDHRGTKLSWGRGAAPGVGCWYTLEGRPTCVCVLNANTESATTRAYLMLYLGDIARHVSPERIERCAAILETLPSLTDRIAEASHRLEEVPVCPPCGGRYERVSNPDAVRRHRRPRRDE